MGGKKGQVVSPPAPVDAGWSPSAAVQVFGVMVIACAWLLHLPAAAAAGTPRLSWLDTIFTAVSTVTLTGLTVRNTAVQFSGFGHAVIAVFIQLGGLGAMVLAALLIRGRSGRPVGVLIKNVVVVTLGLELLGAAASLPMWRGDLSIGERIGLSLFHAVSAFCNAGFSTLDNGLADYRYSPLAHAVIAPLVVLGGLGIPVLIDLWPSRPTPTPGSSPAPGSSPGKSGKPVTPIASVTTSGGGGGGRLSVHSKVVLATSGGLYLYGVVLLMAAQLAPYVQDYYHLNITAHQAELEPLSKERLGRMLADSSFAAAAGRTSAFNTVPQDQFRAAGQAAVVTLMFVGGSPGGTAGGIKTTTLALILMSAWATFRGREEVEIFGQRIGLAAGNRAAAVLVGMGCLVVLGALMLSLSESAPFIKSLFEVVSAAGNAGQSLGITGDLTSFGRCVIIAAMVLGRLGPLMLVWGMTLGPQADRGTTEAVAIG